MALGPAANPLSFLRSVRVKGNFVRTVVPLGSWLLAPGSAAPVVVLAILVALCVPLGSPCVHSTRVLTDVWMDFGCWRFTLISTCLAACSFIKPSQMVKMFKRRPCILRYDVESTLEPFAEWLEREGLTTRASIGNFISSQPEVKGDHRLLYHSTGFSASSPRLVSMNLLALLL